jgi:Ca2+-binding EF-hand superfamily protein
MKVTESEVEALVSELDVGKTGRVNYEEFLKYSYLCQMYIQHLNLEYMLNMLDNEHKGLITVGQLDEML